MAQVTLKKDWFGPDGQLHLARDNPHSIAEQYLDQLPSSAVVGEKPAAVAAEDDDEEDAPKKPAPPVKK